MAALIEKMFAVGETWHGEHNKLESEVNMEQLLALVHANGKETFSNQPCYYMGRDGGYVQYKDKFIAFRDRTYTPLGIVGPVHQQYQIDDLANIGTALIENQAVAHTFGMLDEGRRFWILLKIPGSVRILNDDIVEKYILLAMGTDGTMGIWVGWCPVRVVCANTLMVAINQMKNSRRGRMSKHPESQTGIYMVSHSRLSVFRMEDVKEALGFINQTYDQFGEIARRMVSVKMDDKTFNDMVYQTVLNEDQKHDYMRDELSTRTKNMLEDLSRRFESGMGVTSENRGTIWTGFNAITEWVDHDKSVRQGKRAESVLFGSGSQVRQRAWSHAVGLLG